ncbi:Insect cuticle protein [Trinorchestia longiramus]|nr:Insect cuticle protein [Trinorchestia longiramus]
MSLYPRYSKYCQSCPAADQSYKYSRFKYFLQLGLEVFNQLIVPMPFQRHRSIDAVTPHYIKPGRCLAGRHSALRRHKEITCKMKAVLIIVVLSIMGGSYGRPQGEYSYDYDTAKYDFSWNVDSVDYNQNLLKYGQTEQRDGAYTKGEYYVLLPDTRLMRVEYYADETGFHPTYTFEGTAVYPDAPGYPSRK